MTNDPSDAELLRFVAEFAGLRNVRDYMGHLVYDGNRMDTQGVPDYLHSVDAWLRDVWPKIIERDNWFPQLWFSHLRGLLDWKVRPWDVANADARSRCLALYRALEGTLPKEKSDARE